MPRRERKRITGACFVKLAGLLDLGRLSCALERAPFPLFASKQGSSLRIAAQADLFMGIPIFYYIESDQGGEFLSYRNLGGVEEVQLVNSTASPSSLYAPVINVIKTPKILEARDRFTDKFHAVQVADLPSLVKIAGYKMMFEEPPLPLFAFKDGDTWILGVFARIDDYEEASMFFYVITKSEASANFVRYSSTKARETDFSSRTDEHGFMYVKVIKLAEKHPLVELR